MRKYFMLVPCLLLTIGMMAGCGDSENSSVQTTGNRLVSSQEPVENEISSNVTELTVNFGEDGAPFILHLEDNDTAETIARYVGTTDWRLPIYNYDESDVMEYYDIPSRYDIPSNPETVTTAKAGEVFYSDPNRVVLYYKNAEISEEYTKVGYFDATEDFVSAVENNPVLENWGNKIILISDGE